MLAKRGRKLFSLPASVCVPNSVTDCCESLAALRSPREGRWVAVAVQRSGLALPSLWGVSTRQCQCRSGRGRPSRPLPTVSLGALLLQLG